MRISSPLSESLSTPAFLERFEAFCRAQGLLPEDQGLDSERFLSRSVLPHVKKLATLFNRVEQEGREATGLEQYWGSGSNPKNLRLAYFLHYMPCNLVRMAAVWSDLARLGLRWPEGTRLRAVEFGAGPAAASVGISLAESLSPVGLGPGSWALIEQDLATLKLGAAWAEAEFSAHGHADWDVQTFHRNLGRGGSGGGSRGASKSAKFEWLPERAPRFNLWVSSFFTNELQLEPSELAASLHQALESHLEDEGLVLLVEPALRTQSRHLLEVRRELLAREQARPIGLQVLLPCLGEQACDALKDPEDWCHDSVAWWRPAYFKRIDQFTGQDHKKLDFSFLVLCRSRRPIEAILPALAASPATQRYRIVSDGPKLGPDREIFACGQEGKRRARISPKLTDPHLPERGDVLVGAEIRGAPEASRVDRLTQLVGPA